MRFRLLYRCDTDVGPFFIGQSSDGRFHPVFGDESYGSYAAAFQAIDDLANDATFSILHPETGELLDTSAIGIPGSPGEWEALR